MMKYCEIATSIHIQRPFWWNYFTIFCLIYCVTQLKSKFNTNSFGKKRLNMRCDCYLYLCDYFFKCDNVGWQFMSPWQSWLNPIFMLNLTMVIFQIFIFDRFYGNIIPFSCTKNKSNRIMWYKGSFIVEVPKRNV
jgi:hypothetical protein